MRRRKSGSAAIRGRHQMRSGASAFRAVAWAAKRFFCPCAPAHYAKLAQGSGHGARRAREGRPAPRFPPKSAPYPLGFNYKGGCRGVGVQGEGGRRGDAVKCPGAVGLSLVALELGVGCDRSLCGDASGARRVQRWRYWAEEISGAEWRSVLSRCTNAGQPQEGALCLAVDDPATLCGACGLRRCLAKSACTRSGLHHSSMRGPGRTAHATEWSERSGTERI